MEFRHSPSAPSLCHRCMLSRRFSWQQILKGLESGTLLTVSLSSIQPRCFWLLLVCCLDPDSLAHLPFAITTCDPSAYLKRCSRHSNGFLMSKSPPGYLLSISFPSFSSREPTGFLALSLPVINKGPLIASLLTRCSNFGLRRNF